MKLEIKYNLLICFVLLVGFVKAQTSGVNTANIDFRFSDGKTIITYDIINSSPNELYTITVSVFRKNGAKLNAVSLSGDLKEITGGTGKTIIWEQKKDGYVLDEEIYVTLDIATKVTIPVTTHLLKSAVIPGWGDYRIRNGKYHFIYGLAGYGAIGASIYFNSQSVKSYDSYKNSFDVSASNNFFNKAKQQQTLSYALAGAACVVWTVDLACLYRKTNKVKKQITVENSKYYYDKSVQTNSFTSVPNFINTKLPYDLAMERGDKLMNEEKYEEGKKAYLEAKAYAVAKNESTATVEIKLASANDKIKEEQLKALAYAEAIKKGEDLLKEKNYKEAKSFFENASSIKPKEKYPKDKIEEINMTLAQLENERLYNEQMAQGNALLTNKNYSEAKINFEKALTYIIKDITAINKCKECDNGIEREEQERIDKEYKNLMVQGNNLMVAKKYETAKAMYEQAKSLKPDAVDVNSKLGECDATIAAIEQQKADEEYKKMIDLADAAYKKKLFDDALTFYQKALEIKPGQTYPNNKIVAINKLNEVDNLNTSLSWETIYENNKPGVMLIFDTEYNYFKKEDDIIPIGTGFFISSNGYAITNHHIYQALKTQGVVYTGDKKVYEIEKWYTLNEELDYAIFKINTKGENVKSLKISKDKIKEGQPVCIIGNPNIHLFSIKDGIISSFPNDNDIEHSVPTEGGSSGSPLMNKKGEVVGLHKAGDKGKGNNNFATRITKIPLAQYTK